MQEQLPLNQVYTAEQIRSLAATDLNFWAGLLIPEVAIYQFPAHYQELWALCIQHFYKLQRDAEEQIEDREKLFKLALALPRGFVKTTFMKLLVAYGLVHRLFDFPLVVCSNDTNAENFVADVHDMLSSANVTQLYDSWQRRMTEDNKSQKKTSFLGRFCILKATGVSGGVRGLVIHNKRPDAILCDDVQTLKDSESLLESTKLKRTLTGTVFKAKSPHHCGIIYIGNRYPQNCIMDDLVGSGEFISLVTGALLADGESLWPELQSKEALLREFKLDSALGQAHIWFAEVMNQTVQQPNALLRDGDFALTVKPMDLEPIGAFVTIDPAGTKKNSNDTVIAGHMIYEGSKCEVVELEVGQLSPRDTIARALQIAHDLGATYVFPESIAYQATLAFWFNEIASELKLQAEAIPLHTGGSSKLKRIHAWVQELLSGEYFICVPEIKASVLFQLLAYRVESDQNKDDIIDACSMGTLVRAQHSELIVGAFARRIAKKEHSRTADSTILSALPLRYHKSHHYSLR